MFHECVRKFLCKIWTKNGVVLGMKLYVGVEVGDKTPIAQTTPFEFLTQPKEQPKES
jgi:hypothetical protein